MFHCPHCRQPLGEPSPTGVLEEKRQELADLRERHADLTRQLAANEEVERALRA